MINDCKHTEILFCNVQVANHEAFNTKTGRQSGRCHRCLLKTQPKIPSYLQVQVLEK